MQRDGQTKLALCGCGKLHFTYGSVTVHFEREDFLLFADSVGRLSAMVRQASKVSTLLPGPASDIRICH